MKPETLTLITAERSVAKVLEYYEKLFDEVLSVTKEFHRILDGVQHYKYVIKGNGLREE